jgi:hypothetical protein
MYISNNGEVYDDEEIIGDDVYYGSVYERDDDEYIYEDEYDDLAISLENKLHLRSVVISI